MTGIPDGGGRIRQLGEPGDLGWVLLAHGEMYCREYGWDARFESLVARIVADYAAEHDPVREAAWIAEVDGRRVGCVFCVAKHATTAKLRVLLVDPAGRGHGLGSELVRTCVEFARAAGYRRMELWTTDLLASARRIYQAAGFTLAESEPHNGFGPELTAQTWVLEL